MKAIKFLACLFLIFLSPLAQALNGLYVTLDGGLTYFGGLPNAQSVAATNLQQSFIPNSIRGSVGCNHDFSFFPSLGLGLEVGFGYFGNATYQYLNAPNSNFTSNAYEFLLAVMYHLNSKFDLIGKIGGAHLSPELRGTGQGISGTQNRMITGLGFAYNLTQHIALTVAYVHTFSDTRFLQINQLNNDIPRLNEGLLGLRYRF